jgi:hypothetical protein
VEVAIFEMTHWMVKISEKVGISVGSCHIILVTM